jgi:hypothetical protein
MMSWQSQTSDRPFPGAHSQVPHAQSGPGDSSIPVAEIPAPLPLNAVHERSEHGWVVRLRVHAERVTVGKKVFVSERVVLRRNVVDDVEHIEAVVQHERLRVETTGQVEIADSADDVRQQDTDRVAARQGLTWRRDEHATLTRAAREAGELEETP